MLVAKAELKFVENFVTAHQLQEFIPILSRNLDKKGSLEIEIDL